MATEDPEPPQSHPHPHPHPQTLAAGELVWAKTKGRHHWWPARLHSPSTSQTPLVSSLGADYSDDHRPAAAVKPFLAAYDADALARANTGLAFRAAVANARATAVGILCDALTCPCARGPPPPADSQSADNKVVITTIDNLDPRQFLAAIGSAAVDPPAVGLLDHARLNSWVRALAQGWGPDGPGRYQRRTQAELTDKIDLDMLAEEEEEKKAVPVSVPVPHNKTPKQRRRRSHKEDQEEEEEVEEDKAVPVPHSKTPKQMKRAKASLVESEEDDISASASSQKKDESGAALSGRRERKKSKYLSPPYTNIGVFALEDKSPDSPKKSPPTGAAKKDERKNSKGSPDEKQQHNKKSKVVPPPPLDNVGPQEVLLLVRCFGEDVSHKRHFPKAAEDFLGLLRSSMFAEGADHDSYKEHQCPAAKNAGADLPTAGLVSDSAAAPKQGRGKRGRKKKDQDGSGDSSVKKNKAEKTSPTDALDSPADNASENKIEENVSEKKRGRKKEQDGTQGSVIKRKKMDKTSPKATLGPGLVITPAIPIRQVSAEDIMSQAKSAGGAGMGAGVPDQKKNNLLVSKSPISAIMSGGVKPGEEQDQGGDGGSVVNAQVNALSDQPAKKNETGNAEATELGTGMNVDTLDGDVPARGAHADVTMLETDMNVETYMNVDTLSGDVPAKSGAQAQVTMPKAVMSVDILNGDVPAASAQAQVTVPETGVFQVDMNVECVGVVDVPVALVQTEAMDLEANIPVVDINEQVAAVADVPAATSGLLLPTRGDISQAAAGNKDNASVEVRTVQESYTSLIQVMLPEPYKKVEEVAAGTGVMAAPQGEAQKVEQTIQKKAVADGAIFASHSCAAKGTNGTPCPDAPSSGQKRRNKKPAAYFANPAEIRVKFKGGTMIPTKEELLSEFRKFGVLVESECDISEERREARVVFGKSTEAEAAYTKAEIPGIFGQFGPPWATLGLNYLEAITLVPPAPKPSLARADMRKNVENMISSLKNGRSLPLNMGVAFPAAAGGGGGGAPVSESLLAEMQRLLSKLDKTQPPPGPSGSAPPS